MNYRSDVTYFHSHPKRNITDGNAILNDSKPKAVGKYASHQMRSSMESEDDLSTESTISKNAEKQLDTKPVKIKRNRLY